MTILILFPEGKDGTYTLPSTVEEMWVTPKSFPKIDYFNVADNPRFESQDGLLVDKTTQKIIVCPGGMEGSTLAIGEAIKIIGTYSFAYCNWGTITIGSNVESIEEYAFCESVVNLDITSKNLKIENGGIYKISGTVNITGDGLHVQENGIYVSESYSPAKMLADTNAYYLSITGVNHQFDLRSIYASKLMLDVNQATFGNRTLMTPKTYQTFTSFYVRGDECETGYYAFTLVNSEGSTSSDFEIELTNLKAHGTLGELKQIGNIDITFAEIEGSPLSGISEPTKIAIGLSDTLTTIPENGLSGQGTLSGEFQISKSVTTIAKNAFSGQLITAFVVDSQNPNFKSVDGVVYDTGVTDIILFPEAKQGEYTIPDTLVSIDTQYYLFPHITAFVVNNNPAFSVSEGILMNKDKSKVIRCPGGLHIDYNCPSGVTEIGPYSFYKCSLLKVQIGEHVKTVGAHAFDSSSCETMSVTGNGLTLGAGCMYYLCADIDIHGSNIAFSENAVSVSVADGNYNHYLSISGSGHEFHSASLAGIVMLLEVDGSHFYTNATSQSTSSNVFCISGDSNIFEDNAISSVATTPSVTIRRTLDLTNANTMGRLGTLDGFESIYITFAEMKGESTLEFVTDVTNLTVEIVEGVTSIPARAFYNMNKIEDTVTIPSSVTDVYTSAFNGAARMTTVVFKGSDADTPLTIGPAAFANCIALSRVIIERPESRVSIDSTAFANHNSALEIIYTGTTPDSDDTVIIVVSVIVPLVVIAAIIIIVVLLLKRRKNKEQGIDPNAHYTDNYCETVLETQNSD